MRRKAYFILHMPQAYFIYIKLLPDSKTSRAVILLFCVVYRLGNRLCFFHRISSVAVNVGTVFVGMGQTAGTADTAFYACHTLNEVGRKHILRFSHQGGSALFDAVAGHRLVFKIGSVLINALSDSVGKSAASSEDSSEVGSTLKRFFFNFGNVDIAAVEQRLKLLKGDNRVDIRPDLRLSCFGLFRRSRSDEYDLGSFVLFFDVLGNRCGRRKIVRNMLGKLRKVLLRIGNEGRAA